MQPNTTRRIRVVSVNLIVTLVFLEIGAYFVYPVIFEEKFSRQSARQELQSRTDEGAQLAYRPQDWLRNKAVHPYLGFAVRPADGAAATADTIYEASDHRVIVGLTGGSVANGLYFDAAETLRRELANLPQFRDKEIVVHSFAMGAYKQPQQLLALVYYLVRGGHMDLWINLDGFNEVTLPVSENLRDGVALIFPKSWPVFAQSAYHPGMLESVIKIRGIRNRQRWVDAFFDTPGLRSSTFCLTTWKVLDRFAGARIEKVNEQVQGFTTGDGVPDYVRGPAKDFENKTDALAEAVRIWKRASIQTAAVCRESDIRYFHFLQPNQHLEGTKTFTDEERRIAVGVKQNPYAPIVEVAYPLLLEAGAELREAGLPFHDLTRVYSEIDETIYKDGCCHVNKTGSEIMARAIAETIARSDTPEP